MMKKIMALIVLLVIAVACATPQKAPVQVIEEPVDTVYDEMEAPVVENADEPVTGQVHQIDIANFAFSEKVITVKRGDSITWTNKDGAPHTATEVGRSWDTGRLAKGESKTRRFDKTGTFEYFCEVHPSMKATVIVTP